MFDPIFFTLTLLSAIGCGLMSGIFFIFSNTVMKSLGQLESAQGAAAMQSINRTILNPAFFAVFLGTAVTCILLLAALIWRWPQAGAVYLIAGSLLYLLGSVLVTIVFNVPMNEALDKVEPASEEAANLWANYLIRWTRWNHVRTVASLLGMISFVLALA